ncbi:MAG: hypothetical protein IPI35_34635 [Deltaproteobacteria bacterium]|nr:hypothetical protein [Deltaproteobacteria bacterium]
MGYDCLDQNCDGNDGDSDEDGYLDAAYPDVCVDWKLINPGKKLGDCWDNEDIQPDEFVAINGFPTFQASEIHPDVEDLPYDGVDAACDGDTFEFAYDQDGFNTEEHPNRDDVRGDDYNDQIPDVNPSAGGDCRR